MQRTPKPIDIFESFRHTDQSFTYYSISQAKFIDEKLVSSTQPCSDKVMIEISRHAYEMIIGTDEYQTVYKGLTLMEMAIYNKQKMLHWRVSDDKNNIYTAVKLMSPEGIVQIKLISSDNKVQIIHNVCELPDMR